MNAIIGASALQITGFFLVLISLPIIIACLGIMLAKGAKWAKEKPIASLCFGVALGASSLGSLLHVLATADTDKSTIWFVFYGLMVVIWPIFGLMQYRAKKEQLEGKTK